MYAQAKAAIIPWGVVGDMSVNSTTMLQCQCILRVICGFLNTSELVSGPGAGALSNIELADYVLPGDMWLERDFMGPVFDNVPVTTFGHALLEPRGEVRGWYDVAKGMAPVGTLRVPHGWWKPETAQGLENGLSSAQFHNDGALFSGEPWNLDPVQGLPNLRGGIRANVCIR